MYFGIYSFNMKGNDGHVTKQISSFDLHKNALRKPLTKAGTKEGACVPCTLEGALFQKVVAQGPQAQHRGREAELEQCSQEMALTTV